MAIKLVAGQSKELNVKLTAISPAAVKLLEATWDKPYYSIGDTATLVAVFQNPTSKSFGYRTFLRWTNPYTKEIVGVYSDIVIGAGQTVETSYSLTVEEEVGKIMHIEVYHDEELVRTIRVPDLQVPTAKIVMLGGLNNQRYWYAGTPIYTVSATIANTSDVKGSQKVFGEWNVHHTQAVRRHIDFGTVELEAGESKTLSFNITWDEMMAAHQEVGRWDPSVLLAGIGWHRAAVDRWYSEVIYFP